VLLAIADRADDNGLTEGLSIPDLALMAGIGKRAVIAQIERLEAGGDLVVYRHTGQINSYIINLLGDEAFFRAFRAYNSGGVL
jgi:hypothetical protein